MPSAGCVTTDDLSGMRTPATLVISGGNPDGTGFFTATCRGAVENVGNAAADVSVHYAVDGHAPTVVVTGVTESAQYLLGTVPAAGCTTTDDLSGVATPASLRISGGDANGVGAITATCTGAVDNVGNVAADVSVHYQVVAYVFGGFAPPLGTKAVKSGSTVPVKFQVFDWNRNLMTSTSVISSIDFARSTSCAGTPPDDWQEATSSGGTVLRFDPTDNQFVFNWKTTGLTAGCYSMGVKTADSITHSAAVVIR